MLHSSADQRPKPPSHLQPATKRWFQSVVDDFDLDEHHVRLLTLASEAWDMGVMARLSVAGKGLTYDDRFGQPHARPEVAVSRNCMITFARLLREIDLDGDSGSPDRPPGLSRNGG